MFPVSILGYVQSNPVSRLDFNVMIVMHYFDVACRHGRRTSWSAQKVSPCIGNYSKLIQYMVLKCIPLHFTYRAKKIEMTYNKNMI